MKNKRGIELDMLAYWIIAIAVLIIIVIGIILLSGKGTDALSFIKGLFRF